MLCKGQEAQHFRRRVSLALGWLGWVFVAVFKCNNFCMCDFIGKLNCFLPTWPIKPVSQEVTGIVSIKLYLIVKKQHGHTWGNGNSASRKLNRRNLYSDIQLLDQERGRVQGGRGKGCTHGSTAYLFQIWSAVIQLQSRVGKIFKS